MIDFPERYRVPHDGSFKLHAAKTTENHSKSEEELEEELKKLVKKFDKLQQALYAEDRYSLLLIFQAMDASGKDSTIRAILRGINPAGCQVFAFKQPSAEELDHDFLWRTSKCLPERGRIGVFNRSYYEEVLVVKVHPNYLEGQKLPKHEKLEELWDERYESIRDHEKHLVRNGTIVLKFWLNVSKEEQKNRFLARLDEADKNWKFSAADVTERQHWDEYMQAYEAALNATSTKHAPWYAIPADDKPYMRLAVAQVIVDTLEAMHLEYPEVPKEEQAKFEEARRLLEAEDKV
ncbi:MAG: polyphosphate kinase 2 family protein [Thiothrix sp.]|nr:MAG: polyphosphate kinase 2 family protein [Thiothrix sp.]